MVDLLHVASTELKSQSLSTDPEMYKTVKRTTFCQYNWVQLVYYMMFLFADSSGVTRGGGLPETPRCFCLKI